MHESDATIVNAVLSGDSDSFGLLYDRYAKIVRAVCMEATEDVTDAQDLAQEVMVAGFRKLSTLKDPDRFGAWIIGIARLQSRQWLRGKSRDRHQFTSEVDTNQANVAARREMEGDFQLVTNAMRKLSEHERLAIHLFYLDATDAHAAKTILDVSLSGFYKILERARRKLRAELTGNQESNDER